MRALCVFHFERAHVRMVKRQPLALFKRQAEEAVRHIEGGGANVFQLEIRLHLRIVDCKFRSPQFRGIIAPVMRCNFEIGAF